MSKEHLGLVCLGKSEAAKKLEADIRKAAPTGAPILLWGEPGTGKSSIARIIHQLSGRGSSPFVKVRCSLPEELLEKELFGSARGFLNDGIEGSHAFPGAFERAAGGTLLLDDIGDLSASHQVNLLDALDRLEHGSYGIPGVRGDWLQAHRFRERKPVRSRGSGFFPKGPSQQDQHLAYSSTVDQGEKEDIAFLIRHFLEDICREMGKNVQLGASVLKKFCEQDWPGNIAEIRNALIRLVIMANGPELGAEDLASDFDAGRTENSGAGSETISALSRLEEFDRKEVSAALERNNWIRRKAARDLGLTFRQMNYRVKKFGLDSFIRENRTKSRNTD